MASVQLEDCSQTLELNVNIKDEEEEEKKDGVVVEEEAEEAEEEAVIVAPVVSEVAVDTEPNASSKRKKRIPGDTDTASQDRPEKKAKKVPKALKLLLNNLK